MKAKLLVVFFSLAFLVVLPGLAFAQFGSISGRVTDEITEEPIIMAAITLSGIYGVWYTDTAGYYFCDSIPSRAYFVNAYASGYFPETYPESVIVFEGENTPDIDFALIPTGGGTGSISGRVTDEVTGYPIAGAAITLSDLDCDCVWFTDSTGHYVCDYLPPGVYLVFASATGYYPETFPDSVGVIGGQNTPNIDFALSPMGTGSISGRVTDEETGLGLPMAHVWAEGHGGTPGGGDTWSDTAGYYLIQNLAAGEYTVGVHKDGYEDEIYPGLVTVEEGQNTPDIDFALALPGGPEFGSISGQVIDEHTGFPIIMARVRAMCLDDSCYGEAWSDTGGWYGIQHLCPGTYQVVASKDGYEPEVYPESVIVIAGQNTPNIDFTLSPIGEYGSISGVVTDETTGAHISSAHLLVVGLDNWCYAETWSDTDGFYLVPQLCPGTYEVSVNKPGYIPETYPDPVVVIAGENTPDIDFALIPDGGTEPGSISGRVTDEQTGLPIVMAEITISGMYCVWFTDSAGYYLCNQLPPGSYLVSAQKQGYVPETFPDSVNVIEGQNIPGIDFALTPTGEYGSISGRVTDQETGFPVIMAHLLAIGIDNYCYGEAWSDTSGYYTIFNLCSGIYQVNAHKMGYVTQIYPDSVPVTTGVNTPDIDFALEPTAVPGSIAGTVTDANTGEPIPIACVWAYGEFGHGQAYTDSLGQYTVCGLTPGSYFLTAWAWDYWPQDFPDTVVITEGQSVEGVDFALVPHGGSGEGVITGVVLEDTTFLLPISNALVFALSLSGNWGIGFTDTMGNYLIEGLPVDDYYVFAFAPGYVGEFYDGVYTWEEATLVTPDAYNVDFLLIPCGSGEGRISGVISSDGTPLEGALVYAKVGEEARGFARSSSEGGYVMNGLAPGTYTVTASKVSYFDGEYPDPVEVVYGKASGIDIDLPPVKVGDVTGNGIIDVGDVVFLINYLYLGGTGPNPMSVGDLNCDGEIAVGDVVYLINYLYRGWPSPPCNP